MANVDELRLKYDSLRSVFNERSRRHWAATEARAAGHGGVAAVMLATGMSRNTIARGLRELDDPQPPLDPARARRAGGGRKALTALHPDLSTTLEQLVEPSTRVDPESPLRWTLKGTRRLAKELGTRGFQVSHSLVAQLLGELGYSLQANRKTREGKQHPDRDAQFQFINNIVKSRLSRIEPVISVDTKKKELVGDSKNGGREWNPQGRPEEVRVHDFPDKQLGKAIPYGVYDVGSNLGWVRVGVDHDTAAFAVNTIRAWWRQIGRKMYPHADSILITADGGGSNGTRVRLWKWELQRFADETGLIVHVSHLPPGTSKWNKIEHRLFSFISQNWRGRPLLTHATIVSLIASTTTQAGLKVRCQLDPRRYPLKVKVTDHQMNQVCIAPNTFHGEWNYTISPSVK